MKGRANRPTIHEVARLAGVSIATVSNVLNGTRTVRAETRSAVEKAVAELGYRPNAIARSLITRRARHVGGAGAEGPKLTAVGYLSVDYTARVDLLPQRDERMTSVGIEKSLGGPAANVVVMAAGLGPPWAIAGELVTALGDDADSEWALSELAARAVEVIGLRGGTNQRLSRCIVLVEPDGSRTIVNEPLVLEEANVAQYLGRPPEAGRRHCVHLDGYQVAAMAASIRQVRDLGILTSVHTTGLRQDWRTPTDLRRCAAISISSSSTAMSPAMSSALPDTISSWVRRVAPLRADGPCRRRRPGPAHARRGRGRALCRKGRPAAPAGAGRHHGRHDRGRRHLCRHLPRDLAQR